MASSSDGTNDQERHISYSDELLRLPFKPENSKLLITKESKSENRVPSKIYKVEPPSVLSRVKDFLPRMKQAEQVLEQELHKKSPSELDIESVDDNAPYIEMSFALMDSQADSGEDSCVESDDSQTRDSDEIQTHEIDCGHVTEQNFVITKPVKGHVKPIIEEMITEKRNTTCIKKNKKKPGAKKGSRKRKQR
ncbi:hypothetical protein OS493_037293 [Desmophyllum pertusum]|uniref:Uncharacterized protein n=1 Tax=Desmophyllum pertusum TaxID=174260 RepID=A0A9X0CCL9_9CNID|nr:hypothetical protein OS493_037293 [Desmophyllum pertusum]